MSWADGIDQIDDYVGGRVGLYHDTGAASTETVFAASSQIYSDGESPGRATVDIVKVTFESDVRACVPANNCGRKAFT